MLNLEKGGRLNLEKEEPGLKRIRIGLGWNVNATDTGTDFDLDASVFMLGANGRCPTEKFVVFYNNKLSQDGSVQHSGDNRTGSGSGDDETVTVDLKKVSPLIEKIAVVVTIHEADVRRQNFGQVNNAYIKIYNDETGKEIAKYDLTEDFCRETAIEFGQIYKKDGEWRFAAVGQGYNDGLKGFEGRYC